MFRVRGFAVIKPVILLIVASYASAATVDESPRTVAHIGTHVDTAGYVVIAEGVNAACLNAALYFDVATVLGKTFYTTLLTAKVTGQRIRIQYEVPASPGLCHLKLAGLLP